MYFLERKEPYAMPNILGGHSFPVPNDLKSAVKTEIAAEWKKTKKKKPWKWLSGV